MREADCEGTNGSTAGTFQAGAGFVNEVGYAGDTGLNFYHLFL